MTRLLCSGHEFYPFVFTPQILNLTGDPLRRFLVYEVGQDGGSQHWILEVQRPNVEGAQVQQLRQGRGKQALVMTQTRTVVTMSEGLHSGRRHILVPFAGKPPVKTEAPTGQSWGSWMTTGSKASSKIKLSHYTGSTSKPAQNTSGWIVRPLIMKDNMQQVRQAHL